jgi:hypothetical protein
MKASLKSRLVVRLPDDLLAWIEQQAQAESLDSATWVRATLSRMRNGQPELAANYESVSVADLVNESLGDSPGTPIAPPAYDFGPSKAASALQLNEGAVEMMAPPAGDGGIKPMVKQAPRFSASNQPRWIEG